ncbi:phosphate signaling complex protein PhoU [Caloramator australicus]|uniref:Phosphate-specific transport system accessory protein PhoU n=2 Tax=Caloramator TaxID=44258 RepID=G0V3Z0_9CLOT|nr:phosphate signaling complex protein PhoU [Caloramator australicus]CCC57830.1 Phosphate transport system regulatory protein PhoU [Caloramator australicus RC3]
MTRLHFQQNLKEVKHKVLRMGSLVEVIVDKAVTSLKEQNLELAKTIVEEDDKIDAMDLEIEMDCMKLLALQQPLAKDLRTIATALKIITDLERMGDHAVNISKITLEIGKEPLIKPLIDIPRMAKIAQEMIRLSLDAFVKEDIELAKKVAQMDQEVDDIYQAIIDELLEMIVKDPSITKQATKLMFVGRYLERIADHTTNVCERIIYMVTGKLEEIN